MVINVLTKIQLDKMYKENIQVLICLVENSNFGTIEKAYNSLVCGRPMYSYVENIVSDYSKKLIVLEEESNLKQTITPFIDPKFSTTIILFSDTPLLSKEALESQISKFIFSNENILSMPRGFIFKTENFSKMFFIQYSDFSFFDTNDFFRVKNMKELAEANEIMQNEIIDFHLSNGVKILNRKNVIIDSDVEIGKNTEIKAFSSIKGKTIIGENSVISFSEITNSKIGNNCEINHCILTNANLSDNTRAKPFSTIAKGDK